MVINRKRHGFIEDESPSEKVEKPNHPKRKGWRDKIVERDDVVHAKSEGGDK